LSYNSETGIFRWRENRGSVKIGDVAGTSDKDGYIIISGEKAHRLAWLYHYKRWPKTNLDHINENPGNNWIYNLREITKSGNAINCGKAKNNSSEMRGVHWYKSRKRWQVFLIENGDQYFFGYHKDFDEAVRARLKAEKEFGWDKINKNTPANDYIERLEGRKVQTREWRKIKNGNEAKQGAGC